MATTEKPKLYYFDTPARGELPRQILVYLGIEFEDIRFTEEEWRSTYKALSPLGMSPFYEDGGVKIGGSIAISRYIAERNGLGGTNAMENAQLESHVDIIFDLGSHIYGIFMGPEDKREVCKQEYLQNTNEIGLS